MNQHQQQRAAHAASLASQRHFLELNTFFDRFYWIKDTTRAYWGLPAE